jgi:hypothetical protein
MAACTSPGSTPAPSSRAAIHRPMPPCLITTSLPDHTARWSKVAPYGAPQRYVHRPEAPRKFRQKMSPECRVRRFPENWWPNPEAAGKFRGENGICIWSLTPKIGTRSGGCQKTSVQNGSHLPVGPSSSRTPLLAKWLGFPQWCVQACPQSRRSQQLCIDPNDVQIASEVFTPLQQFHNSGDR